MPIKIRLKKDENHSNVAIYSLCLADVKKETRNEHHVQKLLLKLLDRVLFMGPLLFE